jgi:hypothetical protein
MIRKERENMKKITKEIVLGKTDQIVTAETNIHGKSITIYVKNKRKKLAWLNAQIREDIDTKEKYIYIQDIQMIPDFINIGLGTVLLKTLTEDVASLPLYSIKYINGKLSRVDMDHKDRLIRFYEKNSYNILFYDNIEEDTIIVGEVTYNINN